MLMPSKLTLLGAAGLLLVALPVVAHDLPLPNSDFRKAVVIDNTGSTNTRGYKIYVLSSGRAFGRALYIDGRDTSAPGPYDDAPLPKAQVNKLLKDLTAAMPLTSLPVLHRIRSASFGTSTYVTYKGQKSPDLTFAFDPRAAALKADIAAITKTLGIGNLPRRPLVLHLNKPNTN